MSKRTIKIAMADDHALFRTGVKTSLQSKPDIQVVAEAENGLQLLNLLRHIRPDVVLLDISMPVMDGLSTLIEVKKLYPEIKIIMLSMHNDYAVITRMMELGAGCYLTKESGSELIYEAIKQVYENGLFFNEVTNNALLSGLRSKNRTDAGLPPEVHLTEKEVRILQLMVDERSTKEIADIVDLSPRTVEAIRDKLKAKTGVKSMAGLVMYAYKAGIANSQIEKMILSISKEEITSLFKVSNSILSYINHDLAGQRAIIFNSLDLLKEELKEKDDGTSDNDKFIKHINRALESVAAVTSINRLIKSYVNTSKSETFEKLLIAWPDEIVETIRERKPGWDIKVVSSNPTLQIIYPRIILYSILTELIENANKKATDRLKILIKWGMKEKTFQCEIHDDGPGIEGLKEKQFVPMNFLKVDHFGMGLKIIERTMIDSGGHLFFSKSEHLSGIKVFFEFPVINFTERNV